MTRRTLVFDLDGTLVDSVPDLMGSINRVMQARGLPGFDAAEITAMVGDGAAALVRRVMAARDQVAVPADLDAFMADYMDNSATETRPYPGVVDTLHLLAAQGWRMAVCTNKPEAAARRLLATLGLDTFFTGLAGGDTYSTRKPEPGHLLDLLHSIGAATDDAVMVGDHHNDMLSAQRAGVPCIFAAWGYGTVKMAEGADAIAETVTDLPRLLAALP